ncbi:mannose-6-phosphate isomerase, class I [Haliscomenobacter sp.]|uniref:mannose-6-phosphate isomerase, class I n=1 Tax=Haliscomenobacter sp. TaxID=2717303 RepID=UPI003BAAAE66
MNHTVPYLLEGVVQHYAWGGFHYIPDLLNQSNPEQEPCAELWLGAHPRGMAKVKRNGEAVQPLQSLIEQNPEGILGQATAQRFANQIPYLLKILDVDKMLSIQAHPNKAEAERGFAAENAAGIPLSAFNRNFKDDNHKPEMMTALTDFWLLHGFAALDKIQQNLQQTPELQSLSAYFDGQSIRPLYAFVMGMPQAEIDDLLEPLAARLLPLLAADQLPKASADYWAARALRDFRIPQGRYDRGVISIYLMNVVNVQPGQGIFQDAGVLHAYLEGVNVELMANSDNVFRGGLTDKYVDADTLIQHLSFEPIEPKVFSGEAISDTLIQFKTPAPDFELSLIRLSAGKKHTQVSAAGPEILLVLKGEVLVNDNLQVSKGQSLFFPAGSHYILSGNAEIYKAGMP